MMGRRVVHVSVRIHGRQRVVFARQVDADGRWNVHSEMIRLAGASDWQRVLTLTGEVVR